MIRVGVVGAAGYVGAELVRWILSHPALSLAAAVSRSRAGTPLCQALPGLMGLTDAILQPFHPEALSALDVVILATPHGAARPLAAQLNTPLLIDCAADHRHAEGWVYGSIEWNRAAIQGASRIAAPGCFATAIQLALAPFVHRDLIRGEVFITAATGSTGSGATPGPGTHHPERFANLRAYKVLDHQHVPEVQRLLSQLGEAPKLHFVPISAPIDRGIFATCFVPLKDPIDARAYLQEAYAQSPTIRLRPDTPELRFVRGTGFCDLAVHQDGAQAVVLSALDNLGKGAAAQAIQCLEVALNLPFNHTCQVAPCTP